MKVGIIVTARLGSTRLRAKHLLPILNRPIISYLLERIKWEFREEISKDFVELIIATSEEDENKKFEDIIENVNVFYGSINNIPMRHYEAAKAYNLNAIVSVDGDDILCSTEGMRKVYEVLGSGKVYVKTTGLPFGMNSCGYNISFLEKCLEGHMEEILETGWARILNDSKLTKIEFVFPYEDIPLRFTLDYEEDYLFFRSLIERCGDNIINMTDKEIVEVVVKNKLFNINKSVVNKYWDNFYEFQNKEINRDELTKEIIGEW